MIIDIEDKMLFLGNFKRAKGIKGEIRYESIEDLEDLQAVKKIIVKKDGIYSILTVEYIKEDIIKCIEVDIDIAKSLVNCPFYCIKPEGIIFKQELIGLEVYRKELLGIIEELSFTRRYDLIHISNGEVVPFIEENIKEIDIENKRVVLREVKDKL